MTPDELDVIEQRANAATQGPWEFGDRNIFAGVEYDDGTCHYCKTTGTEPIWVGRAKINGKRMLSHVHEATDPWMHGIYSVPTPDRSMCIINDTREYGYMRDEDAEFIASARSDVPALIAEIRRLQAQLDPEWVAANPKPDYPDGAAYLTRKVK